MGKRKKVGGFAVLAFVFILISSMVSWSFYHLIYDLTETLLADFGIIDPNLQNIVIIIIGIIIIVVIAHILRKKVKWTDVFS